MSKEELAAETQNEVDFDESVLGIRSPLKAVNARSITPESVSEKWYGSVIETSRETNETAPEMLTDLKSPGQIAIANVEDDHEKVEVL